MIARSFNSEVSLEHFSLVRQQWWISKDFYLPYHWFLVWLQFSFGSVGVLECCVGWSSRGVGWAGARRGILPELLRERRRGGSAVLCSAGQSGAQQLTVVGCRSPQLRYIVKSVDTWPDCGNSSSIHLCVASLVIGGAAARRWWPPSGRRSPAR